ncbi:glutamine--fructose-6-phosphate transaminase (isomerizing) [Acidiferrobacter thiooxydans]|uniref:Glutamine--fructose-6-phosphate aminotransferase [isomerizing] n=1 Tax=Acidiferrobacter thiooxydans TaxID=163359 RepID=A0A1C2G330_9GAMM|nr:glutamine--fructose-6-phosphate transaminase (isomerizing) [Acidiferrobacter thiooxydans]RCN57087.1 glutamine--fructose-6-phosphate transaminase (isomerizing) [Acidiferrobacter thiooxydans]UEN99786.1 glutamine--fructose-6-phosphate transaminase (isomerizing) [Acidiferrobacter thiooxydans]
MCGIVGAVAQRNVVPILIEGLKRLEYRGYDSAGIAVIDHEHCLARTRSVGKVRELEGRLDAHMEGTTGIAHTRWATHGRPATENAHPHICRKTVALVHNGIIENHATLRRAQMQLGYEFTSETDTEVIVHEIYRRLEETSDLLAAVRAALPSLRGAYALGVITNREPDRLVAARRGSPLVIGVGIGEHFIASDVAALLPVTQRFIFLEEGDIADVTRDAVTIYDAQGARVERPIKQSKLSADAAARGEYRHYMLKEIHEQPRAIADTLENRIGLERVYEQAFGHAATDLFADIEAVQIVACGTSYHAGLIGRYWLEGLASLPCTVEVASEFRYRKPRVAPHTLFVTLSQSGETADTLAALAYARELGFAHTLAICNAPESSLVRGSELVLMTQAGPEIGVASTKAFTTQLVALLLLVAVLGRRHALSPEGETHIVQLLRSLPGQIEQVLGLDAAVQAWVPFFANKQHALFLGRGTQYPVAMEGALKLKEISYIHAEAYPAGELKHGPLALVDSDMPVVAVAPNNELLEKLQSNLQEVRARGGELFVFADAQNAIREDAQTHVITVPPTDDLLAPIVYTVLLQLLAYHVAVSKGADIDQPRNLAKSVTVE